MAKVILHIGDTVTHTTLGEGIVTIVDDEFVTIKFATDELTFRLPSAFENGFLSSQDAEFIEDGEDEDEDWEEDEDDDEEEDDDDDDEEEEEDEDTWDMDDDDPVAYEEPQLGFFSKLLLGAAGFHALNAIERNHEARKRERDQRWHDTIFWQEAARRKDPFGNDNGPDDW